jgi:hypothetical protein
MALVQIPTHTSLVDGQFITIAGPDGITTSYHYDDQQRALYFKESQVLYPSFHGVTHVGEDPIPSATCDTPGLMSSDDKCKLDALVGTRLGVLGFQGAGFPDDGGWMQGDIILAAGTDFISLERIGNVIRFTVDSPVPLNCACEECQQIFWVQDETDTASIRPPTCGGKLPGVNAYGEIKVYLFPESTLADPNDPSATLNNKGLYPAFIFKRYDDTITPGAAEHEMILKRDPNNTLQTEIGWAFTPGATGEPEMVWFMGKDDDGNQIRFDLDPQPTPGLLGELLYNGHLITKKMGVVTGYTANILTNNQYTIREWDVDDKEAIGDSFTATNVWQYLNAENPPSGANPQQLVLDSSVDLLPVGTLVNLWAFKVGEVAGEPIKRYYFRQRPQLNPTKLWSWIGYVQFGDTAVARAELETTADATGNVDEAVLVSAIRTFPRCYWGLTGIDDPLLNYDAVVADGTDNAEINPQHRAIWDTALPGLVVAPSPALVASAADIFSERPVYLWCRRSLYNSLVRADIGRPTDSDFVPYDFVFRAPVDEYTTTYMRVVETGVVSGLNFVRIVGADFHELPPFGTIRILSPSTDSDLIFNYGRKMIDPTPPAGLENSVLLLANATDNVAYPGNQNDIVELLHQDYTSPVVRVEFTANPSGLVQVQFKVGTLDMSIPYEEDLAGDIKDDFVRGLAPGYAVSSIYSQSGNFNGVGSQPDVSPDGFVVYDGGAQIGGDQDEYWNRIEIMVRDAQVWIWWNNLLIPPNGPLSAGLPTPVDVQTPYFAIENDPNQQYGKNGARLWPGASMRRMDVRTQLTVYNEFTYGQLEIV